MPRVGVLCLIGLMLTSGTAVAQTGSIVGTVTAAETGLPLSDVQVRVQGTGLGALTRENGRYAITAPPGTYTVRVLRLGYAPDSLPGVAVRDGQTTTADLTMRTAAAVLKSVLSVGYGKQEARDRTGVVDQVTSEEFNKGRVVAPAELIQAKVAGVQVSDNAEPGGATQIRIRGGTSVTSSNEPLFVIDGIPITIGGGVTSSVDRNPLDFINANDIESITVLKDASATAIYGSRGANGVIMITTKTGTSQGARVSYTGSVSGSSVTSEADLLNAAQFRAAVTAKAPTNVPLLGTANTDWRDAVQRSAGGTEHALAVAGAGEDLNYRLSLGLMDQKGVVVGTEFKRISAALNYNDELFDNRISMRSVLQGSRTEDFYTPGGVIGSATAMAPTQPIQTAGGQYFEWAASLGPNNPLAELALVQDKGTTYRSIGKLEGEYRLPFREQISVTSRVGYDVAKAERTQFFPSNLRSQIEAGRAGTFIRSNPSQVNTLFDLFGTWRRDTPRLAGNFDVTAGYSYEQSHSDYPNLEVRGLSSDLLGPFGIPTTATSTTIPTLNVDDSRLISFFGRTNLSIRDKYLMTLSVRQDGSSKFGPSNQWGTFPSAAFAWRVIDEPFMKRFAPVSDLKLRFSVGINGNQAIGNYLAFSSYSVGSSSATAQFGNNFVTTIRPSAADLGIKWEQTRSQNLGADWGLFRNRLSGAVDYYYKITKDLIFFVPVAAGTNLSNSVTTNIGELENEGLEFSINTAILTGARKGLSWQATFLASTNRNQLMQINSVGTGKEKIPVGGIAGGVGSNIQVLAPGHPINSFFVYRHKRGPGGVPVYADANNDGSITDIDLYEDINKDLIINDDDKRVFHSPAPKWILGHTSSFGFRNFDAGFTIRAYRGNYVYNNVASNLGHYRNLTEAAPTNVHSSVLKNNFATPQYFSDVYVEDASFIRMDNLSLGYTFHRIRSVSSLRVFGVVQNVFTMTDYTGVDPMAGINGIDNNIYPRSRTMVAGVNVAF